MDYFKSISMRGAPTPSIAVPVQEKKMQSITDKKIKDEIRDRISYLDNGLTVSFDKKHSAESDYTILQGKNTKSYYLYPKDDLASPIPLSIASDPERIAEVVHNKVEEHQMKKLADKVGFTTIRPSEEMESGQFYLFKDYPHNDRGEPLRNKEKVYHLGINLQEGDQKFFSERELKPDEIKGLPHDQQEEILLAHKKIIVQDVLMSMYSTITRDHRSEIGNGFHEKNEFMIKMTDEKIDFRHKDGTGEKRTKQLPFNIVNKKLQNQKEMIAAVRDIAQERASRFLEDLREAFPDLTAQYREGIKRLEETKEWVKEGGKSALFYDRSGLSYIMNDGQDRAPLVYPIPFFLYGEETRGEKIQQEIDQLNGFKEWLDNLRNEHPSLNMNCGQDGHLVIQERNRSNASYEIKLPQGFRKIADKDKINDLHLEGRVRLFEEKHESIKNMVADYTQKGYRIKLEEKNLPTWNKMEEGTLYVLLEKTVFSSDPNGASYGTIAYRLKGDLGMRREAFSIAVPQAAPEKVAFERFAKAAQEELIKTRAKEQLSRFSTLKNVTFEVRGGNLEVRYDSYVSGDNRSQVLLPNVQGELLDTLLPKLKTRIAQLLETERNGVMAKLSRAGEGVRVHLFEGKGWPTEEEKRRLKEEVINGGRPILYFFSMDIPSDPFRIEIMEWNELKEAVETTPLSASSFEDSLQKYEERMRQTRLEMGWVREARAVVQERMPTMEVTTQMIGGKKVITLFDHDIGQSVQLTYAQDRTPTHLIDHYQARKTHLLALRERYPTLPLQLDEKDWNLLKMGSERIKESDLQTISYLQGVSRSHKVYATPLSGLPKAKNENSYQQLSKLCERLFPVDSQDGEVQRARTELHTLQGELEAIEKRADRTAIPTNPREKEHYYQELQTMLNIIVEEVQRRQKAKEPVLPEILASIVNGAGNCGTRWRNEALNALFLLVAVDVEPAPEQRLQSYMDNDAVTVIDSIVNGYADLSNMHTNDFVRGVLVKRKIPFPGAERYGNIVLEAEFPYIGRWGGLQQDMGEVADNIVDRFQKENSPLKVTFSLTERLNKLLTSMSDEKIGQFVFSLLRGMREELAKELEDKEPKTDEERETLAIYKVKGSSNDAMDELLGQRGWIDYDEEMASFAKFTTLGVAVLLHQKYGFYEPTKK